MLLSFFDKVSERFPLIMPREALKSFMDDPVNSGKINKLMRCINLTEEEVLLHFPSYSDMRARHIYDPYKCSYGAEAKFEFTYEY